MSLPMCQQSITSQCSIVCWCPPIGQPASCVWLHCFTTTPIAHYCKRSSSRSHSLHTLLTVATARLACHLQHIVLELSGKRAGGIKDSWFDQNCRKLAEVTLPRGNNSPPSLYLMRKLLGCKEVQEVSGAGGKGGLHVPLQRAHQTLKLE
jgi:hypothetical protein